MQQTQIITYGIAGVLAERLREFAQIRRVWLRETSQLAACQSLVSATTPAVFIMVLGSELERELTLLEKTHAALPGTAIIAVGEADNPALAGLACDLGATYAVFPPTPMEAITEILNRVLEESPA
jgi:DNA-binding NarL/FixJ family response regulator